MPMPGANSRSARFYLARFARIAPLHLATLVLLLGVIPLPYAVGQKLSFGASALSLVLKVAMLDAWVPTRAVLQSWNNVSWSISVGDGVLRRLSVPARRHAAPPARDPRRRRRRLARRLRARRGPGCRPPTPAATSRACSISAPASRSRAASNSRSAWPPASPGGAGCSRRGCPLAAWTVDRGGRADRRGPVARALRAAARHRRRRARPSSGCAPAAPASSSPR